MKSKCQRKHGDGWYDKMLFGMLCEDVAKGVGSKDPAQVKSSALAESLLCSWQPQGPEICAAIRYEIRGPAGLLRLFNRQTLEI